MLLNRQKGDGRPELESKILAAALRQSLKRRDAEGSRIAHDELSKILSAYGQAMPTLLQLQSGQFAVPQLLPLSAPAAESDNNEQQETTHLEPEDSSVAAGSSPMDYLDFEATEDSSVESIEVVSEFLPGDETGALAGGRLSGRVAPEPESRSYYTRLAASPVDSAEVIHLCYIRAIRLLLRAQFLDGKVNALNAHEFRKHLRNVGIAYNILFDASTRSDYDLRLLGLREPLSGKHLTVPDEAKSDTASKAKISLVEILVLSRTFGADTLLAAVEAARTLPEPDFWDYLAQSGAFTQLDFEALQSGLRFIRLGLVSIVQFEQAFQTVRSSNYPLEEILLNAGWIDADRLKALNEAQQESDQPAFKFVEVQIKRDRPVVEDIKVGGNLPSWASQMDWGGTDEEQAAEPTQQPDISTAPVEETVLPAQIEIGLEAVPDTPPNSSPGASVEETLLPHPSAAHDGVMIDLSPPAEHLPEFAPGDESSPPNSVLIDSTMLDFSLSDTDSHSPREENHQDHTAHQEHTIEDEQGALVEALAASNLRDLPEVSQEAVEAVEAVEAAEEVAGADGVELSPPVESTATVEPMPVANLDWELEPGDLNNESLMQDSSLDASVPSDRFAPTDGAHSTDWSRVTDPADLVAQYQSPPEEEIPAKQSTEDDSIWRSSPTAIEFAAEQFLKIQKDQAETRPKESLVEMHVIEISADPMESLPKPAEGQSWESAVADALTQATQLPPTMPASPPVNEEPAPQQWAAEISLQEIHDAPGGSWQSTVESLLSNQDLHSAPPESSNLSGPPEVPAQFAPDALFQSNDAVPQEVASPNNESHHAPEPEASTANHDSETPAHQGEAHSSQDIALSNIDKQDSPPASPELTSRDSRRPREKPARKPRPRREAKNTVQLGKLGEQEALPPENQPQEKTQDAGTDIPSELKESPKVEARKDDSFDALSFIDVSSNEESVPLLDAESRDMMLFSQPYYQYTAPLEPIAQEQSPEQSPEQLSAPLVTEQGPTGLLAEQIFEPIHEASANSPTPEPVPESEISVREIFAPEAAPFDASPNAVSPPSTSSPIPELIDASPDAEPGWSRYKLLFGEAEKQLPLVEKIARIGRNRQSVHVAIQEPAVSREHCQLEIQEDGVVLRDLASRHGTYVVRGSIEFRATKENPIKLQHADFIRLGKPGAPVLEWVDSRQQYDENAPTGGFPVSEFIEHESLRDTGPRQPKALLEESVVRPDVQDSQADGGLNAAARALATSSGLGNDSIEEIMSAMLGAPSPAANSPQKPAAPDVAPSTQQQETAQRTLEDAGIAAAAAAMAASSGLSQDAIDAIVAAMRTARAPAPVESTSTPAPAEAATPQVVVPAPAPSASAEPIPPAPPEPPTMQIQPEEIALVVEVPLVPLSSPLISAAVEDKNHNGGDNSFASGAKNSIERVRATVDSPYADVDALMAAIDAEVHRARKVIEEEDRKRKKLRQS